MHESLNVPAAEIDQRVSGFQRELRSMGIHGALIAQRIDLFYFTGCAQNAYLYVPRSGDPLLLVRKHAGRAAKDSPLSIQIPVRSVREIPGRIDEAAGRSPAVLGLVWDVLPVREFRFLRSLFSARAYVDISELVHRLRGAKSPWEQARIGESADLCLKTLTHLQTLAFPGMSETELAGLAEVFARDHGHGGGIRVRSPFQDSRSCRLSDGACEVPANGPFSLGFNAVVNGYHASRARIFTPPALSDAQQRDIQALESLHARILRRAGSATSLNSVQQAADMETARSVKTCPSLEVRFSFHGIGLELREPVAPDQDTGDWKERTLCLAVETSGRSPQGPPLFLQDTVTLDGTGLRLL